MFLRPPQNLGGRPVEKLMIDDRDLRRAVICDQCQDYNRVPVLLAAIFNNAPAAVRPANNVNRARERTYVIGHA